MEPYQGAATGVGGIVRDIMSMGARPVAVLDPLRFGPADAPDTHRVLPGVVAGIGGYGNCLGLPNIGGEVVFDPCYQGNPLVNALCVGVLPADRLQNKAATGPGNIVVLLGANMPSVLAEISFLSNPADELLLKKGEYRQRLAEGLYQGVVNYLQSLNSVTFNRPPRNPSATRPGSASASASSAVEQSRNQQ